MGHPSSTTQGKKEIEESQWLFIASKVTPRPPSPLAGTSHMQTMSTWTMLGGVSIKTRLGSSSSGDVWTKRHISPHKLTLKKPQGNNGRVTPRGTSFRKRNGRQKAALVLGHSEMLLADTVKPPPWGLKNASVGFLAASRPPPGGSFLSIFQIGHIWSGCWRTHSPGEPFSASAHFQLQEFWWHTYLKFHQRLFFPELSFFRSSFFSKTKLVFWSS